MKREKKARQYLIDLQRWRSAAAFIACGITLFFSVTSIVDALIYYSQRGWLIRDYFRYFTTLSNLVTALAAGFILPFAADGIRKKRFVYPKWLFLMHYSGTIGVTMTMMFALIFILPWDPEFAVGGRSLFLHVICPLAVLVSFELVESGYYLTRRNTLVALFPILAYSLIYLVMVVFVGKENGGWEDMYMLNTFVPFYISLPLSWLMAYVIASLIRITANYFGKHRQKQMLAHWREDMEPVEVNIEMYGLGRYNGLHGDKSDLGIPYDILEVLAEKYSMETTALMKVYTKGLLDAVQEKKQR